MTAPFWAAETPQKEEPDFQAERGGGDGRNKVCRRGRNLCPEIRWQTQSCSITPVLLEGAEEEAESLYS